MNARAAKLFLNPGRVIAVCFVLMELYPVLPNRIFKLKTSPRALYQEERGNENIIINTLSLPYQGREPEGEV